MVKLEERPEELDEQQLQTDPLQQMGYEAESRADREREIQEFERNQPTNSYNQPEKRNWLRSSLDKVNKGRQQTKALGSEKKNTKENDPGLSDSLAGEAREKAKEKAKKELARIARQRIKQAVVQFISKNPYVWAAVGIILLIIIIVAIIFALFGLGGKGGNGPAIYPSTTQQKDQATLLAALSGNKVSNDKLVLSIINDEKERYSMMLENAKKYSPDKAGTIESKSKDFANKLDQLLIEKDTTKRIELKNTLQKEMLDFEGTLPFGKWISEIAMSHKDAGSLNFCKITKAGARVACASFVSTVLWQAGVPNPIQASVDSMWKHPATRIIVNRPASKSAGYYKENESKLKPGDVIFWGDGACSKGGSVLFDHVGVYIGNGQAVDNSSSKERIRQDIAADRGSCRVFNGAKRYGAN